MALPACDMSTLLEAGVHFGHRAHRWNPKMAPFIFDVRNGLHIIDLTQTVPRLSAALQAVSDVAAAGGRILFVGTKRQAARPVAEQAKHCAQYYVNARWLGGALTNWQTISHSIKRLKELEALLENESQSGLTKKELLKRHHERNNLERSLGGIKDMNGLPDLVFVIDTNKEAIAVAEARKLGIPVVAVVDSNSDPDGIAFPIPGNDDSARAVVLYCDLMAQAVLDGLERSQKHAPAAKKAKSDEADDADEAADSDDSAESELPNGAADSAAVAAAEAEPEPESESETDGTDDADAAETAPDAPPPQTDAAAASASKSASKSESPPAS